MNTIIMKGKPVADAYREKIVRKIHEAKQNGRLTNLAVVVVGDDPASHVYKNRLVKLIKELGGSAQECILPADATEEKVVGVIKRMNRNRYITGILPMMPMPKHINEAVVSATIAASKDVDCLSYANIGEFFAGSNPYAPCTPRSCMAILEHYGVELEGKNVVVIGRSNVVGKPVAMLLLNKNATVTLCHSKTKNLAELTRQADIVVAAVGKPCFVTPDMVKEGVVIVDVGINSVDGKLVGDVDPVVEAKASFFTPVPGGVGVVSNMMVMDALTRHV